jgi:mannose-6-phosphate isomerase
MWYMRDGDARIIVGFKEKSNSNEYLENLKNKTLLSILDDVKVKKGCFPRNRNGSCYWRN